MRTGPAFWSAKTANRHHRGANTLTYDEWQATREYDATGDDFGYDAPVYQYDAGFIVVDLLGGFAVTLPQRATVRFDALQGAEAHLWAEWCGPEING